MRRAVHLLIAVAVLWMAASGAPAADAGKPRPKNGRPNICAASYPKDALSQRREGTTELLFTVNEQGMVAGVIIAASSGTLDLDFTSASCATNWQYVPVARKGVPVAATEEAHVGWSLGSNRPPGNTPKIAVPAENCILTYAGAPDRAAKPGLTIVRYQLAKGAVTGAVIERSSGSAAMDGHAVRCVSSWHFEPVMENGAAATGAFAAIFDWQQKAAAGVLRTVGCANRGMLGSPQQRCGSSA